MDRILLTGSTGFIGSNLTRYWNKEHELWHLLRKSSLTNDRLADVALKHIIYWEDLMNGSLKVSAIPSFSACYHFAVAGNAFKKQDMDELIDGNITRLIRLMDFCKTVGVGKFIHMSSWSEYGNHGNIKLGEALPLLPDYLYGASKAAGYVLARAYAKEIHLPLTTFRLFSLFGFYDKPTNLIPSMIKAIVLNRDIKLTPGEQVRDFVFLGDLLQLFDTIQSRMEFPSTVYNVCSGKPVSVRQMAQILLEVSDGNLDRFKWGAKPYRDNETMVIVGDPTLINTELGWETSPDLKESLLKTFRWYEMNPEWLED